MKVEPAHGSDVRRRLLLLGNPLIIPFDGRFHGLAQLQLCSLESMFVSVSSSFPSVFTQRQPGTDRVALSSVLKGQRHAHSNTRTHGETGVQTHIYSLT